MRVNTGVHSIARALFVTVLMVVIYNEHLLFDGMTEFLDFSQERQDAIAPKLDDQHKVFLLKEELAKVRAELASVLSRCNATIVSDGSKISGSTTILGSSSVVSNEFNRFSQLVTASNVLSRKKTSKLSHADTLMRRSRPVIGNTERLRGFISKLINKECTTVAFVGGSVTFAHPDGRGGYKHGYHAEFVKYLNEQYPCEGGEHVLYVHGPGGTDAAYAVNNFNQLFRGANNQVDFVSFEYAVNDASATPRPGHSGAETIQINNEILFRKALKYRNKDGSAPAVICLETSFFNKNMLNRDMMTSYGATHVFTAGIHFPILTYYDIPTISAAQVWFPMLSKDLDQLKNRSLPISNVFMDGCHPSTQGHTAISQILAYNIEIEKAWMLEGETLTPIEKDLTLDDPPKLPNPWWLTDEEAAVLIDAPSSEFSFQQDIPDPDSLLFNTGWKVFADSKSKFGLIANKSASHVAFKIDMVDFNASSALTTNAGGSPEDYKFKKAVLATATLSPTHKLSFGYLKTYTNISDLLVWTDDKPDGRDICNTTVVTSPGFCYEVGCTCDAMNAISGALRKSLWPFLYPWIDRKDPKCIKDSVSKKLTEAELGRKPKFYTPTTPEAFPNLMAQVIKPLQKVTTSVYSYFDVALSPVAIEAAGRGDSVYVHACSMRFGELTDPAIAGDKEKPAPFEGDGKFKILLLGAINGHVRIDKIGEHKIEPRMIETTSDKVA